MAIDLPGAVISRVLLPPFRAHTHAHRLILRSTIHTIYMARVFINLRISQGIRLISNWTFTLILKTFFHRAPHLWLSILVL